MTYLQAISDAMREEMRADERVFLMGEDIGVFGGAFKVTEGFIDEFGPMRVMDTPLSECGILGTAVGMALYGLRPVPEIQFLAIGLVRNPVDVVHSSWRRWGSDPEANQHEWLRAARNLQRLSGLLGPRLALLRYEDVVRDPARLDFAHAFAGVPRSRESRGFLHADSIQKWRRDPDFRFALAAPVRDLALELGYRPEELASGRS